MAKVTITIPSVTWRDGRPRYNPGPETRKRFGLKAQDLKRDDGSWMSAEEALAWVTKLKQDVAAASGKARPKQALAKARPRAAGVTVAELAEAYLVSPRVKGSAAGKRVQKGKADNTIAFYRQKLGALERHDPDLYGGPAEALTKPICAALYEDLWEKRGLATARAVIASLSVVLSWAIRSGRLKLAVNPALGLDMQTPEPRLRAGTPAEIAQLVAAADLAVYDLPGRKAPVALPEIGDCILLGVWTGQRQADRLAMTPAHLAEGRLRIRQGKRHALVDFPVAPQLKARLKAAEARREGWTIRPMELVVREHAAKEEGRKPYDRFAYAHLFARVRQVAAEGVTIDGAQVLAPMPSVADLTDQDLRDTCVTWLARAGADVILISRITGHSLQSVHQILKHYLVTHPEQGDRAISTLVDWFDRQTG